MSMSFSLAPKPYSSSITCCRRFGGIRSEVVAVMVAPKQRRRELLAESSGTGVPLADLHVDEVVEWQCQNGNFATTTKPRFEPCFLKDGYEMCRKICKEYAKTFYLGN
ncbi:hypothetical protein AHAS_Ahas04G0020900 [Arachis hypogaea]